MTVQTIQVSSASGLLAALAAATGGETLQLAPGNYGAIYLTQYNFTQPVTIVGGTFAAMQVTSSNGLDFEGTTVNFVPDMNSTQNSQGVRVWQSQNINFNNATLVGGPSVNGVDPSSTTGNSSGNVIGLPVGKGINFDTCNDCSITNSDISMFAKGVTFSSGNNLLIDNNDIHDLRTTPISGTIWSNLTITNNHSWDSYPWNFGGTGDHGDRIHVWTNGAPLPGLVISNNYLDQGAGYPMLGIYLDDNRSGNGFPDAVVTGNTLIDGTGQGVLLENVSGIVANNTLIWSGYGTAANNAPRFDVNDGSDHITFTDNVGAVSIETGSNYLTFIRQTGMIAEDVTMSSADRDTISIDYMVITARNSYTLNATTSDLYFEGGTGNFVGTGNALANTIVGSTGSDTLTGNGGADYLEGRTGNDTYVVDNAAQRIYDSGGTELVKSSVSWTLQTGLENLTYTGTAGATLGGNSAPNIIIGGGGADRLLGNGGADTLQGGLGNDTYVIDNLSQKITETGGTDTIESSLNWTLQSGIEKLTLTGSAVIANGNTSANTLRGNASNNTLDGKTGADIMYGGAGDDTYFVENAGDQTVEVVGSVDSGGYDIIKTTRAAWTMASGTESMTYTGTLAFTGTGNSGDNYIAGAAANDVLNGGSGNDRLVGNAGDDRINGGGGIDLLTGGTGNDIFVFVRGESNADEILDFNGRGSTAGDVIEFQGWGAGTYMTRIALSNFWTITDGVDGFVEYITVTGLDPSDVVYTRGGLSGNLAAADLLDAPGVDLQGLLAAAELAPAADGAGIEIDDIAEVFAPDAEADVDPDALFDSQAEADWGEVAGFDGASAFAIDFDAFVGFDSVAQHALPGVLQIV